MSARLFTIRNETTPEVIALNRARLAEEGYLGALTTAQDAITDAGDAVTAVEAAGSLAVAQAAVSGLGATLSDANDAINSVLP